MSSIAYTLFCDDVRHEEGFKYSPMGVYVARLILDEEEQTLPKFVALTVLEVPMSECGQTGRIQLLDGDVALISGDVSIPPPPDVAEVNDMMFLAVLPIEVAPFAAKDGMHLRVNFSIGNFSYTSTTLEVMARSNPKSRIFIPQM